MTQTLRNATQVSYVDFKEMPHSVCKIKGKFLKLSLCTSRHHTY